MTKRGFTLVEIIVVVAIISLLSSVVIFSVSDARKQSRDKLRLADIEQLELNFKLYREAHNGLPSYDNGIELGVGASIDDDLATVQIQAPRDRLSDGPGGDATYQYVYDSSFDCTAPGQTVVYINQFEKLNAEANGDTLCTGADGDANQYVIILSNN